MTSEKESTFKSTEETNVDETNVDEVDNASETVAEDIKAMMEEFENRYKRLQADFDNFRKRTQSEKEQLTAYVKSEVIHELLPVVDNFERALQVEVNSDGEAFLEGFKMIHQNLLDVLYKLGLEEIKAIGEEFDPNFHQAVMRGPHDELPDNHISEVYQKGYTVGGRVIRPSMVKVVNND